MNWFQVGLALFGILGAVLLTVSVFIALRSLAKNNAKKIIITSALTKIEVRYNIAVYLLSRGSMVQTVYGKTVDSVFKVAQYAPPNFDNWSGSHWRRSDYGLSTNGAAEYSRRYEGDDGQMYVIVVRTDDGFWPISSSQYLERL